MRPFISPLLVSASLLLTTPAAADDVVVASEPVCPYLCADADTGELASPPGIAFEIIRDALSLHGHRVSYQLRPLARALREVKAGHLDAVLTWEANVPGFVLPDDPVVTVDACFFKRHDDPWQFQGVDSLQHKRLGIILGDTPPFPEMEQYLQLHVRDKQVEAVAGSDAAVLNIRKLLAKRIDLLFDEKQLTHHHLQRLGYSEKIIEAGCLVNEHPVFMAFSPQNPASQRWARELAEGIRRLKASGRIEQIWGHYGLRHPNN